MATRWSENGLDYLMWTQAVSTDFYSQLINNHSHALQLFLLSWPAQKEALLFTAFHFHVDTRYIDCSSHIPSSWRAGSRIEASFPVNQ